MINRIVKISSFSGAILVFCGVLKLIFFYRSFDISIVDYLSFSEIITSFLDDVNLLLIFFIVMTLQSLPIINLAQKKSKMNADDFYNHLMSVIYPNRYKYVLFFAFILILISIMLIIQVFYMNYFLIYCLIFCTIQIMTFITIYKDDDNKIDIKNSSILISVLISIIFAIFLLARHDIQNVYAVQDFVTIRTNDTIIKCNSQTNIVYLGKTDSYIFIKDLKNQTSSIIPVREIKELSFRKLK